MVLGSESSAASQREPLLIARGGMPGIAELVLAEWLQLDQQPDGAPVDEAAAVALGENSVGGSDEVTLTATAARVLPISLAGKNVRGSKKKNEKATSRVWEASTRPGTLLIQEEETIEEKEEDESSLESQRPRSRANSQEDEASSDETSTEPQQQSRESVSSEDELESERRPARGSGRKQGKRTKRRSRRVDMKALEKSVLAAEQRHQSLRRRLQLNSCPSDKDDVAIGRSMHFDTTATVRRQHLAMILDAVNSNCMDQRLLNVFHVNSVILIDDPPLEKRRGHMERAVITQKELRGPEAIMQKWVTCTANYPDFRWMEADIRNLDQRGDRIVITAMFEASVSDDVSGGGKPKSKPITEENERRWAEPREDGKQDGSGDLVSTCRDDHESIPTAVPETDRAKRKKRIVRYPLHMLFVFSPENRVIFKRQIYSLPDRPARAVFSSRQQTPQ